MPPLFDKLSQLWRRMFFYLQRDQFDREFVLSELPLKRAEGVIIAACTVGDDYDNPQSRIGVRKAGGWLQYNFSGDAALSVDASQDGSANALGENGTVVSFDWRTSSTHDELRASCQRYANPRVDDYGPLRRIRVLGRDVICAGSAGQVYRLRPDGFEELPTLSIAGKGLTGEDIAGTGRDDILAVTSDGHAAHFDGTRWSRIDLPTNASLTSICSIGADRYAIAGKAGTLVIGSGSLWRLIPPLDVDRSYWGVGSDSESLYMTYLGGIDLQTTAFFYRLSILLHLPLDRCAIHSR